MINPEFMLKVFNNTVKGLRAKTEVWCHTCWGNPSQQRMFAKVQSYKPALELLNQVDADVITFEMESSNCADLEDVGKQITTKKIGIGAIDHHTLQVESPDQVAALVRQALKVIPAERLMLTSDCGMGREGMSRRHAFYKMVSLVQGVNIVKKELGLPVTESLAADPKLSLLRTIVTVAASISTALRTATREKHDQRRDCRPRLVGEDAGRSRSGTSDEIRFVAGTTRTTTPEVQAFADTQKFASGRQLRGAAGGSEGGCGGARHAALDARAAGDRGRQRPESTSSARSRSR